MDCLTFGIGVCRFCGSEFEKRTTVQVYCDPKCRWNWWYREKGRRAPVRTADLRECAGCGAWFVPWQQRQRCCDVECSQVYFKLVRHLRIVECEHCGQSILSGRAKRWCSVVCMRRARVLRSATSTGLVYFVQAEQGGPIKIGRTDDNPVTRLALIQNGNPYKLVIRAVVPGGQLLEQRLHQRFASHRMAGEWFEPAPEIVALMGEYAGGQMRLVA